MNLQLRKLKLEDCKTISEAFNLQGWHKPISLYEEYYALQESGKSDVIIAVINEVIAGYLTITWSSDYQPFRDRNIPEIVDFNVLLPFQRKGIGAALMSEAEKRICKKARYAGIRVGLFQDYGPAQIMYVKKNYVPDGAGIINGIKPVSFGEKIEINDDVVLALIKDLHQE